MAKGDRIIVGQWREMSMENLRAAKSLLDNGCLRSCVNRAYFAAYAAITSELVKLKRVEFAQGRKNPSHDQVLTMLVHNLGAKRFGMGTLRQLNTAVRSLRRARLVADYVPGEAIDKELALMAVKDASKVLDTLGIT